jgi:transcription elongation factor Elf1
MRGWPLVFHSTNLPYKSSTLTPGVHPVALLCDLFVISVLMIAAWNLPGRLRLRFYLAEIFTITTAFALTLSFHLVAWDNRIMTRNCGFVAWKDQFEMSQVAVGVGVFSLVIAIARAGRGREERVSDDVQH